MSLPDFFFERVTTEIHQQMDGVLALAERLSRERLNPDAQACVAGVLEAATSVRRMLSNSSDLRNAARAGVQLEPAPCRVREIMDEVLERWRHRAADGGVTLLVAYDGDPDVTVMIDAAKFGQVFDGFVAQAMSAVRRGAVEASLKAVPAEGGLRLEGRVRGGGEPVAADGALDIRSIEARFGLETALSVALGYRMLGAMEGEMRIDPNPGAGETVAFELTVPLAQAEPAATAGESAASAQAVHILIVDDNATNRMVAETLCEMFDCTSESAEDGVEAVEAAKTGRFDLILMDIKMPRMDGVAATRAIRGLPGAMGRVPIIALTANADPEDAAGYIAAGMNGVVEKPMKPETLLRALQEALAEGGAAAAA